MMTVHKAKGLEFPIVILADLTCKLDRARPAAGSIRARNLCALKLGGWAPMDLLLHDAEEAARDRAEGERLAYVAAAAARGTCSWCRPIGDEGLRGRLARSAACRRSTRRRRCVGTPSAAARVSGVSVERHGPDAGADGDPAKPTTSGARDVRVPVSIVGVWALRRSALEEQDSNGGGIEVGHSAFFRFDERRIPGLERRRAPPNPVRRAGCREVSRRVVDPTLVLQAPRRRRPRRDDLIAKDGDQAGVDKRMGGYRAWQGGPRRRRRRARRRRALSPTRRPSSRTMARYRHVQTTDRLT